MYGKALQGFIAVSMLLTASLAQAEQHLPAFNVDIRQSSISGVSSGGYMAQQFHVAYADLLQGAGVIAGGPYYCAENSLTLALTRCMRPTDHDRPDWRSSVWYTDLAAERGSVADTAELAGDWVWLYSSRDDETVVQAVMDQLDAYYRHYLPAERVRYVNDRGGAHAMPTDGYGDACDYVGASSEPEDHFINDCGYDAAGELLQHIYRRLAPPSSELSGRFIEFLQSPFIYQPRLHGMLDEGYAYVPAVCEKGGRCRVHVALHGCLQSAERIGDAFYRHAGYNEWAESNRMIVLYPQAAESLHQGNGNGCWDWWGYDDDRYAFRQGRQLQAIRAMLERLAGAAEPVQPPAAPQGVQASVALDGSVILEWEPLIDPQVQGYLIYRSALPGGPYLRVNSEIHARTQYEADILTQDYFVVVAVGAGGVEGLPSPEIHAILPGL